MPEQTVYYLVRYVRVNAEDQNKQSALKAIYDTTRTFMYIGIRLSQEQRIQFIFPSRPLAPTRFRSSFPKRRTFTENSSDFP